MQPCSNLARRFLWSPSLSLELSPGNGSSLTWLRLQFFLLVSARHQLPTSSTLRSRRVGDGLPTKGSRQHPMVEGKSDGVRCLSPSPWLCRRRLSLWYPFCAWFFLTRCCCASGTLVPSRSGRSGAGLRTVCLAHRGQFPKLVWRHSLWMTTAQRGPRGICSLKYFFFKTPTFVPPDSEVAPRSSHQTDMYLFTFVLFSSSYLLHVSSVGFKS